jgi:hypothetical protein
MQLRFEIWFHFYDLIFRKSQFACVTITKLTAHLCNQKSVLNDGSHTNGHIPYARILDFEFTCLKKSHGVVVRLFRSVSLRVIYIRVARMCHECYEITLNLVLNAMFLHYKMWIQESKYNFSENVEI